MSYDEHTTRNLLKTGIFPLVREWMLEDITRFVATTGQHLPEPSQLVLMLLEVPRPEMSNLLTFLRSGENVQAPKYLTEVIKGIEAYSRHERANRMLKATIEWIFSSLEQTQNHFDDRSLDLDIKHLKAVIQLRLSDIEADMKRADLSIFANVTAMRAAIEEKKVSTVAKLLAQIPDDY